MEDSKGGSSRLVFFGKHGEVVMYFNANAGVTSYDVVNRKTGAAEKVSVSEFFFRRALTHALLPAEISGCSEDFHTALAQDAERCQPKNPELRWIP